jgi:hypothetical protein
MKEVRWRAVSPDTFMAMLKIEGNFSRLRARPAHFVGHLPRMMNTELTKTADGNRLLERLFQAAKCPVPSFNENSHL